MKITKFNLFPLKLYMQNVYNFQNLFMLLYSSDVTINLNIILN